MSDGFKGAQTPESGVSDFSVMSFVINQILNRANTSTLVQVKAVTNSGGLSAVGYVDIQPLVSQLDGDGNAVPHGVVYHVPYFRLQGGTDAVIIDPKVGDTGIAVFADHDISSVKANKGEALPGSMRRFDMADGLYQGGFLNGIPNQYVQFTSGGINVVSPTKITCTAPVVEVDASTSATVISPIINLYNTGQTLRKFVMDTFKDFFNNHKHSVGGTVPTVPMDDTYLTTNVKGS
jgi:hypothetical protein